MRVLPASRWHRLMISAAWASNRSDALNSRAARSAPHEPYHRVPGPLAAPQGTGRDAGPTADQIVRRVREQLGVH